MIINFIDLDIKILDKHLKSNPIFNGAFWLWQGMIWDLFASSVGQKIPKICGHQFQENLAFKFMAEWKIIADECDLVEDKPVEVIADGKIILLIKLYIIYKNLINIKIQILCTQLYMVLRVLVRLK